MPKNEQTNRAKFIRDHQLRGHSRASALEQWAKIESESLLGSEDIAQILDAEGVNARDLSQADIARVIADWKAIRGAGL